MLLLTTVVIVLGLGNCQQGKFKLQVQTQQEQIEKMQAEIDSIKNGKLSGEMVLGANKDTVQAFLPFDPQKVLSDSLKWANQADSIQTLGRALVWKEKQAYKRHLYNFNQLNRQGYEVHQKLQVVIDSLGSLGIRAIVVHAYEAPRTRTDSVDY